MNDQRTTRGRVLAAIIAAVSTLAGLYLLPSGEEPVSITFGPMIGVAYTLPTSKVGVGCTFCSTHGQRDLEHFDAITWYRTWGGRRDFLYIPGVVHVPAWWCEEHPRHTRNLRAAYPPDRFSGAMIVLNEPDLGSQCNKTPAEAVTIMLQVEAEYSKALIVGPSVTQERGIEYIDAFRAEYKRRTGREYEPFAYDLHLYHGNITKFKRSLNDFTRANRERWGNRGVWVSEFGVCAYPNQYSLVKQQIQILINHPDVDHFAYFVNRMAGTEGDDPYRFPGVCHGFRDASDLFKTGGWTLTGAGRAYAELPPRRPPVIPSH